MPNHGCDEVRATEYFIQHAAQILNFVVVERDEDNSVLAQELPQQRQPGVHHAEPFVVAAEVFGFFADDLTEPLADAGIVDVVVVDPAFVAGVVRRVDVNALDLPAISRQQRLECFEIISFDQQVFRFRIAHRQLRIALQ